MRSRFIAVHLLAWYTLVASGLPLVWHLAEAHSEPACCADSHDPGLEGAPATPDPGTPAVPAHDGTRCETCFQIAVVKTAVDLPADDGCSAVGGTYQAVALVELPLTPGERFNDAAPRAPPC